MNISLSARRSSIQVRDGMKRTSAQAEKKMMDNSMDNEVKDPPKTVSPPISN